MKQLFKNGIEYFWIDPLGGDGQKEMELTDEQTQEWHRADIKLDEKVQNDWKTHGKTSLVDVFNYIQETLADSSLPPVVKAYIPVGFAFALGKSQGYNEAVSAYREEAEILETLIEETKGIQKDARESLKIAIEHQCAHSCTCQNINWRALRVQKMILLNLLEKGTLTKNEVNAVDGIIEHLDNIQEEAVSNSRALETDVFTDAELDLSDVNDAPFVLVGERNIDWLDAFATREAAETQVAHLEDFGITARVISKEEWNEAREGAGYS